MEINSNLTGKLLIAMPEMGDPRFARSVVLIAAHSTDGAMGLIINKPINDLRLFDLIAQIGVQKTSQGRNLAVHFGGPVDPARGFVLHSDDYLSSDPMHAGPGLLMSATQDVLKALSTGGGPQNALIAMGYAGWGSGQLEQELSANGWLTCDASDALIFDTHYDDTWSKALATIGVTPLTLSSQCGHA